MSADNVKLVQSLYAAFGRGDIAVIIGAVAPDVIWRIEGNAADHPLLGVRRGNTGVAEFFKTLSEVQDAKEFSPKEFYAAEDRVFVIGHYKWTMKKTGKPVESDFIHVFTIRNGKVAAFREFTDTAQFSQAYRG